MRVAIDGVGRIVIPKAMRDELGVSGPAELELTACNGTLELTVPDAPAHVEERDGLAVIVLEDPPAEGLSAEDVRSVLERVRR